MKIIAIRNRAQPNLLPQHFHNIQPSFTKRTSTFIPPLANLIHKKQSYLSISSKEILVVEDNTILQHLYSKACKDFGYSIKLTESALHALRLFTQSSNKYNMIIIDVGLPDINGIELSKLIRKYDSNVPIVIITAYDAEEIRKQCCDIKINHIVTKPVSLLDLKNIIEKHLPN